MVVNEVQAVLLKSVIVSYGSPVMTSEPLCVHKHFITVILVFSCFNTENETRSKKPVYYDECFNVKYMWCHYLWATAFASF